MILPAGHEGCRRISCAHVGSGRGLAFSLAPTAPTAGLGVLSWQRRARRPAVLRSATRESRRQRTIMVMDSTTDTAGANGAPAGRRAGEAGVSRLEEARMLVRARRKEVKERQEAAAAAAAAATAAAAAAAAAETAGDEASAAGERDPRATQGPGSSTSTIGASATTTAEVDVAAAAGGRKNAQPRFRSTGTSTGTSSASRTSSGARGYSPRIRPGTTGRGARGRGGRGAGGVRRKRVLPDFTNVRRAVAGPSWGVGAAAVQAGEDDPALVSAIRATLDQTRAQLSGRQSAVPAVSAAGGARPALPHGTPLQGWLRVVGLLRRACGGEEEEEGGGGGGGGGGGRVDGGGTRDAAEASGGGQPPLSPPRVAFELALQVCVLCERPDAGLEVLNLMRSTGMQAGLEAYKTVLKDYPGNRKQGKALFTVQMMMAVQEAGLVPDIAMLAAAMDACSKARDTEGAMHFMDQAVRLGLKPDDNMFREAIIAFSLAGKWSDARDLALQWRDQASAAAAAAAAAAPSAGGDGGESVGLGFSNTRPPPPPAVCNTAILKAMGKAGKVDEALAWLEDAAAAAAAAAADTGSEKGAVSPARVGLDHSSFMAVLSACSKAGRWESARSVLGDMDRAGVVPETVAFNTVLAAFEHRPHPGGSGATGAKNEPPRWPMALELLADMERRGVEADVVTYNSLINVLRWGGQWSKALEILEGMNAKGAAGGGAGVQPDVVTYNSAIAACASGGEWKRASQLIDQMQRKGLQPDRYSYTSAIHACGKARRPLEALRLLRAMETNNVVPDVISMTACMDALAAGGKWSETIKILDEMRSKGITPNERTYKAAIQACGRGGQWQRALELLSRLENRASGATVQEYNCAMMACVTGGEPGRALDLLEQMKANKGGVNAGPDIVTYTSAIMACSLKGKWDRALSLLDEMRKAGPRTQPNVRSYTAAIAACGRARKWEEAVALHSRLREEGLTPDQASYNAVIRAARRGGQHKLSMKLLASMVEAGLAPDAVTVGELISSLSDRGRWDEAQRVVEIAEKTGAIPASSLDSTFEVDVSHLPSAIAKVKVRATLQRILAIRKERSTAEGGGGNAGDGPLEDLVFVTGTGSGKAPPPAPAPAAPWDEGDVVIDVADADEISTTGSSTSEETTKAAGLAGRGGWRVARYSDRSFSLGNLLVDHLRTAFEPPLRAEPGEFVAGCLVVKAEDLEAWAAAQEGKES